MVLMEDSQRAAELSRSCDLDVGLHLNLTEKLTQKISNSKLLEFHNRVAGFLTESKFSWLIYNPLLRSQFHYVCSSQYDEFRQLYGTPPSHLDGHHHMHLCANLLLNGFFPRGQRIRRSFSYDRKEKGSLRWLLRSIVDALLIRRYSTTDLFFALFERIKSDRLSALLERAQNMTVELETHPECDEEYDWLMRDAWEFSIVEHLIVSHAQLCQPIK